MNSKLIDNRRRKHAAEVLEKVSKKSNADHAASKEPSSENKSSSVSEGSEGFSTNALREQYGIIREDFMKLKEDVQKGYDLAREWAESNLSMRNFYKFKTLIRSK